MAAGRAAGRPAAHVDRAASPNAITFGSPITVDAVNQGAEPSIRVDAKDPNHRIWAGAPTGLGARAGGLDRGGDLIWHSDDNGATWTLHPTTTIAGGGDTDVVGGFDGPGPLQPVYVTGLTLANVTVASSCTNGAAFATNAASTAGTIEDRQWLDAYEDSAKPLGAPDVLLDIGLAQLINPQYNPKVMLYQMTSGGGCTEPHGSTPLDTSLATCPIVPPTLTKDCYQWPGNVAIDELSGDAYVTYNTLGSDDLDPPGPSGDDKVVVARIDDGGSAFVTQAAVHPIVAAGNRPDTFDSFTVVAVDNAGNVYVVWTERHPEVQETWSMLAVSTDHGDHWSAPVKVNSSAVKTTTFPWIVAGDAGRIDVVYYGTDATGPSPETVPGTSQWRVYMAQSLNATSATPTFEEVVATPVMHEGSICTSGTGCAAGTRDLLDFFQVDIDELGLANIVYTKNFPTSGGEFVTFVQQNGGTTLLNATPTAVTVRTFRATRSSRGVELRWWTASENGVLGFNVFRGSKRVNARVIRAHGGTGGASYRVLDRGARGAPRYRLEILWADGRRTSLSTS